MKKIYKTVIFLFIIMILAACQAVPVNQNSEREFTDKTKSIYYNLSSPTSNYPGMETESIVYKGGKHQYSVRVPKLKSETWDQEMDQWTGSVIDNFEKNAENSNGTAHNPLDLKIDYQIYYYTDQYISVKFEQSLTSPDEGERKFYKTYNFDRKSGKFINFADFFKDGSNYLEKISKLSQQKLSSNKQIKGKVTVDQLKKELTATNKKDNFLFKNERLTLLFEADALGIQSNEALEVQFTKNELRDILKKKTPIGIVEEIKKPPVNPNNNLKPLDPNKKIVALSFDDGPYPTVTPRILDILAKYNARATFFVLGFRAEDHPQLLQRAVSEGHEIGNHSYGHPRFTELSESQIKQELKRTDDAVTKATGKPTTLFRPPYGDRNETVIATVDKPIITWSVDTRDWESQDPDAILQRVQTRVKNGSIILMHDTLPTTADALELVLQWLTDQGYQVVTVSELLGFTENPELAQAGRVYNSRAS